MIEGKQATHFGDAVKTFIIGIVAAVMAVGMGPVVYGAGDPNWLYAGTAKVYLAPAAINIHMIARNKC